MMMHAPNARGQTGDCRDEHSFNGFPAQWGWTERDADILMSILICMYLFLLKGL